MANAPKLEIIIGAKADQLKTALADLAQSLNAVAKQANQAGAQTSGAFAGAETQFGKTRAGVQSISEQLSIAKSQLIGFFSVQYGIGLAKDLIQVADAFTGMNARLKLATQSSAEYATAQTAIFGIAQRTATSLESNIILYARIADSMRAMGKSQQDALAFTELTGQAMRISGASAESAKAGVTQLAQAMASGVLRGDEFNSIMENSPRLAKALADGLNVPIGKLRELAEAGKLTADKVVGALLSQSETLSTEYAKITLTVGASLTQLSNAWTKYLGEADQAEGATKSLALAISDISQNFTQYANAVLSVGRDALVIMTGFGAIKLGAAVMEFAALIGITKSSSAAMTENALANAQAARAVAVLAAEEKVASTQVVIAAEAHKAAAIAALAEAEGTLSAASAAGIYGNARAAAEHTVTAARATLAAATAELSAAETANAAALARSATSAGIAAPAIGRLTLATGLLMKSLGPLVTAFLAFEVLKTAGQWMGEFAAKMVVGDQDVKKFSEGTKLGMEVAEAATKSMAKETAKLSAEIEKSNGLNAFNQVGESAQSAKDKIKASVDAMIKSFNDIVLNSGDVGKALEKMWNATNYRTPAGVTALFTALNQLKEAGKATGEQIESSLQKSIEKLDVTQLRGFQMALQLADVAANDMANTLDLVVGAALKKLGTDAETVASGLSKGFHDTEQIFQLLSGNARATGAEIKFAFDKMLDSAKTTKEAEALRAEFEVLKETGKLSAAEIKDEYVRLQDKLNETAGQIDGSIGDSFKRLGIKSAEAMKAAFDQLVIDFNRINESGKASAEGIDAAYQKIKSSVVASVQAMTTASREALQAAKDHTATVQATTAAIAAQATANTASANAQKADAEYARASEEAMKSGSEAARAKADALGVAAQAAHAAADAAQADAAASQAAAVAAQAEEAAKKAIAAAAANPNEWTRQAAANAQDYSNRMAQAAESAKQTAVEAHALADEMASASSAASILAAAAQDSQAAITASNKAVDNAHFIAVMDNANEAWKKATTAVQGYIDKAIQSGEDTSAVAGKMTAIMSGALGTGQLATEAMQELERSLQKTADATKRNEDATKAWASAMDGLRGIAASLKDELDRALGNDKAIEDRAYADKKKALQDQLKAAQDAAAVSKDTKSAAEARAAYQSALADLDQIHAINLKNIADAAAAKSSSDSQNHVDELARIAAESSAREIADQAIQTAQYGGSNVLNGASAASVAASAGQYNSYGGNSVTNTVIVKVDGKDLLSTDQIRNKIIPVINQAMNRAR